MGTINLSDIPLPQTEYLEAQAIADIVFLPETLLEAEKIINEESFSDSKYRKAWLALKKLTSEGKTIDLSTAYAHIDRDLMTKGVLPRMESIGSPISAIQHFSALRDANIKRKCYFSAVDLLQSSANMALSTQDVIGKIVDLAEKMQKETNTEASTKHISQVINEVAENIEGVVHYGENGWEFLATTADDANKTITFTVSELSPFAIVYNTNPDAPTTGDSSNMWIYITLMVVSVSALGVVTYNLKKREN